MSIRAVALDLDGTLLDTIADLATAANAMRQALALPALSQQRIQSHVGGGMASLVHRALTDDRDGTAHPELFAQGMALLTQHYDRQLTVSTRPYPGVREGLQALHDLGLPLACVTNKSARFVAPLLQGTGLASFFSLLLGGDSLPQKKPHPLPLLHCCQQFAVQPDELLMIGDSHYDLEAGRNAGSPVLLLTYGYEDVSDLPADGLLASLVEAVDFVKNRA